MVSTHFPWNHVAICPAAVLTLLAELALAGASETLRCTRHQRKQEQMETNPIIHDISVRISPKEPPCGTRPSSEI